jgi:hypothetical protein
MSVWMLGEERIGNVSNGVSCADTLGYTPLTVHWSLESSPIPPDSIGFFGSIALVRVRDWVFLSFPFLSFFIYLFYCVDSNFPWFLSHTIRHARTISRGKIVNLGDLEEKIEKIY